MGFEVDDFAELAALDQSDEFAKRREEALIGPDPEHDPSRAASLDRPLGLGLLQRQRLLAEHRRPGRGNRHNLLTVQRVGRRQHDRVDSGVSEHRLERAGKLEPMLGRIAAKFFGIAAERVSKPQRLALALNRFDEPSAPPAETDDRRVDHRLSPAAPNSAGGATEMLVEKGEDLAPAVDRLLRAIVRAIPGEKRVSGAVIAVEFVVLAVTL
jgi:hypothetical protein